jgi:hypothetical protein
MSMSSKHTKVSDRSPLDVMPLSQLFQSTLENLHPNISCMRHPDHIGAKGKANRLLCDFS